MTDGLMRPFRFRSSDANYGKPCRSWKLDFRPGFRLSTPRVLERLINMAGTLW